MVAISWRKGESPGVTPKESLSQGYWAGSFMDRAMELSGTGLAAVKWSGACKWMSKDKWVNANNNGLRSVVSALWLAVGQVHCGPEDYILFLRPSHSRNWGVSGVQMMIKPISAVEYFFLPKKEGNLVICDNMYGTEDY